MPEVQKLVKRFEIEMSTDDRINRWVSDMKENGSRVVIIDQLCFCSSCVLVLYHFKGIERE